MSEPRSTGGAFALGALLGAGIAWAVSEHRPRACQSCGEGLVPIRTPDDLPPGSSTRLKAHAAQMLEQGFALFGHKLAEKWVVVATDGAGNSVQIGS